MDDIIDSGHTMDRLLAAVRGAGAAAVWTAVLLSKRAERRVLVPVDFVAFEIPNEFIVGYGLDYNQSANTHKHTQTYA